MVSGHQQGVNVGCVYGGLQVGTTIITFDTGMSLYDVYNFYMQKNKPIETIDKENIRVFTHQQSQTHRDVLLEGAGCWSCDGGGLGYCGCSRCGGDKSAGLTWLWGFGDTRLLGLGLNLCECQTARGGDGALHLHRRVP